MTNDTETVDLSMVPEQMRAWRQHHPRASLTEIERELDRHLHAARASVLAAVASSEDADLGRCPACDGMLVRRGTRKRILTTSGDAALALQRSYTTCRDCGAGLSPPG